VLRRRLGATERHTDPNQDKDHDDPRSPPIIASRLTASEENPKRGDERNPKRGTSRAKYPAHQAACQHDRDQGGHV
jgi:hypothetical protein